MSGTRNSNGTFKQGFTANPNGAPRKTKQASGGLRDILFDPLFTSPAKDLPPDIPPQYEHAYRMLHAALSGRKRARRLIVMHIERRERENMIRTMSERGDSVQILVDMSDSNKIERAFQLLNIASETSELGHKEVLLNVWAVQAAFNRRHGGFRLVEDDLWFIEQFTVAPDHIQWPRNYLSMMKAGLQPGYRSREYHD